MRVVVEQFGVLDVFEVDPLDTISVLKMKIHKQKGFGPDVQFLSLAEVYGEILEDARSFVSYGVQDGMRMVLEVRACHSAERDFEELVKVFRCKSNFITLTSVLGFSLFKGSIGYCSGMSRCLLCDWNDERAAKTVKAIENILANTSTLKSLEISSNPHMGDDGIIHVLDGLKKNMSIEQFGVSFCGITSRSGTRIGDVLEDNFVLKILDISYSNIGNDAVIRIAEALESNVSLTDLFFNHCGMTARSVRRIGEMLEKNTTLQNLCLSNDSVCNAGVIRLAEGLEVNDTLKRLHLCDCGVTTKGCERLAQMLSRNTGLEILHISRNHFIGFESVSRIALSLETNRTLKEIRITDCKVTEEGAKRMGEMLEVNNTLKVLDLSANDGIGDVGAARIGESLKKNMNLEILDLGSCRVTSKTAIIMGKMLEVNTGLKQLDISYALVEDEGAVCIAEGLERNSTLRFLYMQCSKLTELGKEALRRRQNTSPQLATLNIS